MEVKSKPIPVTILDFMAILLPGLVWILLLFITFQLTTMGQSSIINPPAFDLREMFPSKPSEISWTPIILLVVAIALLIGYTLKPIATGISEILTAVLFKRKKEFRDFRLKELRYPYNHFYKNTECHKKICDFIKQELQCSPNKLPGHQPFSTAKKFIRLTTPMLWEECERMEAEVRMFSALFLAAVYNFLLSAIVLISKYFFGCCSDLPFRNTWIWLAVSIFAMFIFAESFNLLRFREVGYVYLNALLAERFRTSTTAGESSTGE